MAANAKSYGPLLEALDNPFAKASDQEWAWQIFCNAPRRIEEGVLNGPLASSKYTFL